MQKWSEWEKNVTLITGSHFCSDLACSCIFTLVGEPMIVGSGDFCSQSDVRGDEPSSLVGEEPRLAGRGSWGEWLQDEEEG